MDQQIVVYKSPDGSELPVKTDGETVWLTQEQMCKLFGRTQPVIARHIANVFKEGELPKEGFMQILHKSSMSGGRPVAIYNLDVVISVGYRRGVLRRRAGFAAEGFLHVCDRHLCCEKSYSTTSTPPMGSAPLSPFECDPDHVQWE